MVFSPYFILYMASICINAAMIIYLSRNRRASGVAAFIAVLVCCSLWSFACGMEINFTGLYSKLFWAKISYPAHTFGPVAWFVMILLLTERRQWVSRRNVLLLCIVPVLTCIIAVTNFHGLMWVSYTLVTKDSITVLSPVYGPWFIFHSFYADTLDILSILFMLQYWKRQAPLYAKRCACLILPVVLVWIFNTAYLFKLIWIDITPIVWGASTPFIFYALFRENLFDLVPFARERIMETLDSGIVIIDTKGRVVDLNPAAAELFCFRSGKAVGISSTELFKKWPELLRQLSNGIPLVKFKISRGGADCYYESSCLDAKQNNMKYGKILIIRDITEQKQMQAELLESQRQISVQEERDRMARDLHDNLGQILGFVNVQAQAVREYLKDGQPQSAESCLDRLSEVAREAHNSVRETILAMRGETAAPEIPSGDYFKNLGQEICRFEKNSGIGIFKDFSGAGLIGTFNSQSAMQISKIIMESLNNIRKHAHADKASVICREKDGTLAVVISDNGCGFDVEQINKAAGGRHFGLLFMKERAAQIGGCLSVSSKPGQGTAVRLEIPLADILVGKESLT